MEQFPATAFNLHVAVLFFVITCDLSKYLPFGFYWLPVKVNG